MATRAAPPFERNVLDALPLTVYTVDLDGRITSANRSWSRFAEANGAGQLADEATIVGTSIWNALVETGSREQVERAMALLRTGRAPVVRWEFPCSSPEEARVFLMQVAPLHGSASDAIDGDPTTATDAHAVTGYVFSTVDITPSHRSREALIDTGIALSRTIDLDRVFHEVAYQVLRAVPGDAFALAMADDDTAALRIVHQVGYLSRGGGDDDDGAAESAELAQRLLPNWLEALANERTTIRHGERGLELTTPLTSAEGALGAMTVLADDIESPQRLDEAERVLETLAAQTSAAIDRAWLVRRVEQKRRLEAIGEVAAGVAHELRNPLFGISSAAQLLRFRTREDPVVERTWGASCARWSGSTAWSPRSSSTAGPTRCASAPAIRTRCGTTCSTRSAACWRAARSWCAARAPCPPEARSRRRRASSTPSSWRRCSPTSSSTRWTPRPRRAT
jgi:hypothetical protein